MEVNEEFECQRCGHCCFVYQFTLQFGKKDLGRWRSESGSVVVPSNYGRYEILDFVCFMAEDWGDLWFHPETGKDLWRCPFLRKVPKRNRYRCMIYPIRPEVCRRHPFAPDGKIPSGNARMCPEARRLIDLHPELECAEEENHEEAMDGLR